MPMYSTNEPYFSYDLFLPEDVSMDGLDTSRDSTNANTITQPPSKRVKLSAMSTSTLPRVSSSGSLPTSTAMRPRMRNFQCPHPGCGKSFADNAHLRDHTFVHTGEKNLRCPDCDKCFARVASLRSHRRVHTGERPFVCVEADCGKRYASRSALRMHANVHAKAAPPPLPPGKLSPVKKRQKKTAKLAAGPKQPLRSVVVSPAVPLMPAAVSLRDMSEKSRCRRLAETIKEQRQVIMDLKAQLATTTASSTSHCKTITSKMSPSKQPKAIQTATSATTAKKKKAPKHPKLVSLTPMVAPLHLLQDGIKPFQCMLGCGRTFSNYFQLAFHAKQHPTEDPRNVLGDQLPFPVGPKYCPVAGCEFSEEGGKCMKTLQIVKRHWQRVHQNDRPFLCPDCPPMHAPKAFKTKDNLTAHRKECKKRSLNDSLVVVPPSTTLVT
ncbi:hypothetical protein H310_01922 [Aphanomyces invadans]|uniref:C2H2-type domain-containing protein n=1 Tax=Aphanomyces invadans TaxID=157072 RepID=A0A024UNK5_9STRA|nr:hypothetical protein H310_01922 [Aphanomyces invadans]ETW07397.1 hypothetical protein H310_01922 [Aphanomyces invadans]|eukprot:XP_008863490.1 hypothetical protein H310_01922 [Aphanomyces invadans]